MVKRLEGTLGQNLVPMTTKMRALACIIIILHVRNSEKFKLNILQILLPNTLSKGFVMNNQE